MIKTWEFVKAHAEYVYALICFGLATWSFTHGDVAGGWVSVGIGLLMIPVLQWLRPERPAPAPGPPPLTFEQGEIEALRKAGMEPLPIPGENLHDPENCPMCEVRDL